MQWLNEIVDELIVRHPDGEILIETGSSPSGTYHLGHLRELLTADAILLECRRRGHEARLIQFVDDLDALRKIPANVPETFERHLGKPICDVPAPDDSDQSYADYFLQGLVDACKTLGVDVEFVRSHEKYRSGFFVPAIELGLQQIGTVKKVLEEVSGRSLEDTWSPVQILEDGKFRKEHFVSIDMQQKIIVYRNRDGEDRTASYQDGTVKLDWRLDFPAHWLLQNVACEPSGRDHSTKGGSVDTGEQICRAIYNHEPPLAVAYDFINMVGDTKKMSASKGTGLDATEGSKILPAEVIRYFVLGSAPSKRLYFDPVGGVVQLMDEFAAFTAREDLSDSERQLSYLCTRGIKKKTVSRVPFSLLVNSYQAALKDVDVMLRVIDRTEYADVAKEDVEIIKRELGFIDNWLELHAPEEIKFSILENIDASVFSEEEKRLFRVLAVKTTAAPVDADGEWFHNAIYECRDELGMQPKDMFASLYLLLIGKTRGPRAGLFLSILPRDWLLDRLQLGSALGMDSGNRELGGETTKATYPEAGL